MQGPWVEIGLVLVLDRLGHLPDPGETVQVDGWQLEVLAVDHRAITRLRLTPNSEGRIGPPADRQGDPQ